MFTLMMIFLPKTGKLNSTAQAGAPPSDFKKEIKNKKNGEKGTKMNEKEKRGKT